MLLLRKIIRTSSKPRVTPEPYFDILNEYFKDLLTGKHPQHTKEIQEALSGWNNVECSEDDCSECLFCKRQAWIEDLGTNAWDLCDIIQNSFDRTLKKERKVDLMDVPGLRYPGSAFSRK